jgi:muramoyltetrapeptide carboxypeptidase
MLVQLIQAAHLKNAAGIVFGNFTKSGPEVGSTDQTVSEVLHDHFSSLGIPVVTGYSIGHIDHQVTLAVGMMAELDADRGLIRFKGE